ncbi:MAG TPA: tryptophan synthase subunit alpha, partial [Pseudonocardiaceae bacterium]|nr:tryptophan synthase subunit alpha [Pseudonocardiaceae bacterium]
MGRLDPLFAATRAEGRAALVGYLPAGYPTVAGSKDLFAAMLDAGCDLV